MQIVSTQVSLSEEARRDAHNHITHFLQHFPVGQWLEIRTFKENIEGQKRDKNEKGNSYWVHSQEEVSAAVMWAEIQYHQGYAIYLGQNPRLSKPATKENVTALVAAYADVDLYKSDKSRAEFNTFVEALPLKPSLIVNSGGGLQVIYLFQPSEDKKLWFAVQEKLRYLFLEFGAGQEVITDESRVLRLTPFCNRKLPDTPRPTAIQYLQDREPATLEQVAEGLSASIEEGNRLHDLRKSGISVDPATGTPKLSGKTLGQVPEEIPESGTATLAGRNSSVFSAAMALFKKGYTREEFQPMMEVFNEQRCRPPLEIDELNAVLDQVCKYGDGRDEIVVMTDGEFSNLVQQYGDFDNEELEESEYILTGVYPREVAGMIAPPDCGKSTLMLNACMSACAGKDFPPIFVDVKKPLRVAYLDFENRAWFLQKDMRTMRTQNFDEYEQELIRQNLFVCVDKEIGQMPLKLSNQAHLQFITQSLLRFKPHLIVVDTITEGFDLNNENDNREFVNTIVTPMKTLCNRTGASMVLIHHTGKNKGAEHADMMDGRGASAFQGAVRTMINLEYVRQGGEAKGEPLPGYARVVYTKMKGKKPAPMTFKQDFERRFFEPTDEQGVTQAQATGYLAMLAQLTKQMSPSELVAACELAKVKDASRRTIDRALHFGQKMSLVERVGHGQYAPTEELRKQLGMNVIEMPQGQDRPKRENDGIPVNVGEVHYLAATGTDGAVIQQREMIV